MLAAFCWREQCGDTAGFRAVDPVRTWQLLGRLDDSELGMCREAVDSALQVGEGLARGAAGTRVRPRGLGVD